MKNAGVYTLTDDQVERLVAILQEEHNTENEHLNYVLVSKVKSKK